MREFNKPTLWQVIKSFSGRELLVFGLVIVLTTIGANIVLKQRNIDRQVENASQQAEGRSTLSNCQEIEALKRQVRDSVTEGIKRTKSLTGIPGYGAKERAESIADGERTLERFHARNCYALPSVREAGIRPPKD